MEITNKSNLIFTFLGVVLWIVFMQSINTAE